MNDSFRNYPDWLSRTKDNCRHFSDAFSSDAFITAFKRRADEISADPALRIKSRKIKAYTEFSLLKERLKDCSALKILITQTVRPEKIERLIKDLQSEFPLLQLHLFGKAENPCQDFPVLFHGYPQQGRFLLSGCSLSLLEDLRKEKFDAAIIPYYNYCGKGYENIKEILNALNIPLKIGVGIEGDLFVHE